MITLPLPQVALRLGAALLLGALVGLERERRERSAGLRTLSLVSLGSALMMIISAYGFAAFTSDAYAKVDPSRIAAQVVSGIGFLGAGAIILRKEIVSGLTTAAAIWLVAGIGLACGIGMLAEAAIGTVLGLVVLAALRPVERLIFPQRTPQVLRVSVQRDLDQAVAQLHTILARAGILLDTLELHPGAHGDVVVVRCSVRHREDLVRAAALIRGLPQVRTVQASLRGAHITLPPATRMDAGDERDEHDAEDPADEKDGRG